MHFFDRKELLWRKNYTVYCGYRTYHCRCFIYGIRKYHWKYTPSKETKDLSEYYGLTSDTDVALICNNEVIDTKGKLVNGEVYLSYETVRNYLNARFYWDPNENILRYTTANDLISVNAESSDYTVNKDTQSFGQTIVKADASTAYIAIDFVKQYSDFSTITIRIQTVSFLPMHGVIIPLLLQSKNRNPLSGRYQKSDSYRSR